MKYIQVIDTASYKYHDVDNSFIVAVCDDEYELLKSDLYDILNNQEDYEDIGVYESMMKAIRKYDAYIVEPDFNLEW